MFISYHHGGDRDFYEQFSQTFCDQYDVFHDNSPERAIDSDDADYIRWRVSAKHITNTSCTIVLIGRNTWGRRFVDWEIHDTLDQKHALIGVMLPTGGIVPARLQDNVHTGYAPTYSWAQITQSAALLQQLTNNAISRPKYLINNDRERRYRSEPLGLFA